MKKISYGGARVIACAVLTSIIFALAAFSVTGERTVSLLGVDENTPVYHGDRSKARVAIMINVYENAEVVDKMIDLLKENNAKATFFVGGCWADDNAETVRKIVESGMEIANHGYFHKDCKVLSEDACEKEIVSNHTLVKALCGVDMELFAPPSGSFDDKTLKVCGRLGYKTIMWSKDTIDWRDGDVDTIFRRATDKFENGDMILMHPKKHSLEALGKILSFYKEKGVETVTVSEII